MKDDFISLYCVKLIYLCIKKFVADGLMLHLMNYDNLS